MTVPVLVREPAMVGTGYFPLGQNDLGSRGSAFNTTGQRTIYAYDVSSNGKKISNKRAFLLTQDWVPDGLKVSAEGLVVTGTGHGVDVLDDVGQLLIRIQTNYTIQKSGRCGPGGGARLRDSRPSDGRGVVAPFHDRSYPPVGQGDGRRQPTRIRPPGSSRSRWISTPPTSSAVPAAARAWTAHIRRGMPCTRFCVSTPRPARRCMPGFAVASRRVDGHLDVRDRNASGCSSHRGSAGPFRLGLLLGAAVRPAGVGWGHLPLRRSEHGAARRGRVPQIADDYWVPVPTGKARWPSSATG